MASKPAFAQGAQVEHGKFGLGSVISCNDDYIVIKFDDHGEKKFVASMARKAIVNLLLRRGVQPGKRLLLRRPKPSASF
jgi:hypothetical protein